MERRFIKLPLPANITTLEALGIRFPPGSRVGIASKYAVIMQCDHMFIVGKGDAVELAS